MLSDALYKCHRVNVHPTVILHEKAYNICAELHLYIQFIEFNPTQKGIILYDSIWQGIYGLRLKGNVQ
jgi:hypothetical protein